MRKKTKSRTYVPVTRRIKRQRRFHRDLEKNARDPIIRKCWNNRKSTRKNMEGLTLDKFIERIPGDFSPSPIRLSEQDTGIIKCLVGKYGNDFEAMSRDRRLNYWQWTSTRCERLIRLYHQKVSDLESRESSCNQSCGKATNMLPRLET